jgi:hypothetical protein
VLVAATVSISAFTVLGGGVEPSQNLAANAFSRRGPPITAYSLFIKGSLQDYSPKVGMATGISCPRAGPGPEEAPVAWGVCQY